VQIIWTVSRKLKLGRRANMVIRKDNDPSTPALAEDR
jgi:hypothetical protein